MINDQRIAGGDTPLWTTGQAASWTQINSEDAAVLQRLILTAQDRVGAYVQKAISVEQRRLQLPRFPRSYDVTLPMAPLISVESVIYHTPAGENTMPEAQYFIIGTVEPGRIALEHDSLWPTDEIYAPGVQIKYTCGHASSETVPQMLTQAISMLVAHWYDNRQAAIAGGRAEAEDMPYGIIDLLEKFKVL